MFFESIDVGSPVVRKHWDARLPVCVNNKVGICCNKHVLHTFYKHPNAIISVDNPGYAATRLVSLTWHVSGVLENKDHVNVCSFGAYFKVCQRLFVSPRQPKTHAQKTERGNMEKPSVIGAQQSLLQDNRYGVVDRKCTFMNLMEHGLQHGESKRH